ncbi:glycoside hydrolase family 20 zincin-like fold domain-containing protein [Puniceicoccaceae bacterium K14]|nr:glycoside hydrolase family 20 zincin-like fold domain-containing protein [Puniceicoccaceae bacterium K14]
MKNLTIVFSLFFAFTTVVFSGEIRFPKDMPTAVFAGEHIQGAMDQQELTGWQVDLELDTELGEQAYRITRSGKTVRVAGGDTRGVMYGGLELAERIRFGKALDFDIVENKPSIEKRGIKFNIPLDARTPSFHDAGHAAQNNILEMWNWDFWEQFLDDMALNRYNALTFWNAHPFPSLVDIPEYEDVALDDVAVCRLDLWTEHSGFQPSQLVSKSVLNNLKIVKVMPIEEKIDFWRKVMSYAKDRGIDIYFITWNICANSVAAGVESDYKSWETTRKDVHEPGKYGITHEIDNPITLDYYRKAVKTLLLTYPDLKGIGVTAGEHMPKDEEPGAEMTRERWLWEAYGLGILDAKKEQPNREVHFIHRVWFSDMDEIMKYWGAYPDPFEVSFKYAKARLYSAPEVPFAKSLVDDLEPLGLKSWWNLRNDDIFYHRWGDPDYVRDFLEYFPEEVTAGYHMGSDGYVWGREYVSKETSKSRVLEIDKHWYSFMLWGRLGYDRSLNRDHFVNALESRFPDTQAGLLHDAWQNASKVIPLVNRFHWRDWDFMWAVEGCKDRRYRTVEDFYDNPTMEASGILNPKAYVEAKLANQPITDTTPLDIAEQIELATELSLAHLQTLSSERGSELDSTLQDIKAMALLGQFYAAKIRATVAFGFYKQTGELQYRQEAVDLLQRGLVPWNAYTALNETRYRSQVFARTLVFDWAQLRRDAEEEIRIVLKL